MGIQPSFMPSIQSSLNQSNISSNNFNNTQPNPLIANLDKSRGEPCGGNLNHQYYGSFQDSSNNLSQTIAGGYLNSSFLSGIPKKNDASHKNKDVSLNAT